MLIRDAGLQIVNALHVGNIRTRAGIRQRASLTDRLELKIGCVIGKGVAAGVVIELVPPDVAAEGKYDVRSNQAGPCGRNIQRLNFRALVLGTDELAVGAEASVIDRQSVPCG